MSCLVADAVVQEGPVGRIHIKRCENERRVEEGLCGCLFVPEMRF